MFFRPTCHFFSTKISLVTNRFFKNSWRIAERKQKNEKNEITNTVFVFLDANRELLVAKFKQHKKILSTFFFLFFNSTGILQNWKGCCNNFENHFFSCITSVQKSHVSCFTSVHTFSKKQQKHFFFTCVCCINYSFGTSSTNKKIKSEHLVWFVIDAYRTVLLICWQC